MSFVATIKLVAEFLGSFALPSGWTYSVQEETFKTGGFVIVVKFEHNTKNSSIHYVLLRSENVKGIETYIEEDVRFRLKVWGQVVLPKLIESMDTMPENLQVEVSKVSQVTSTKVANVVVIQSPDFPECYLWYKRVFSS